uniref:Uncharacterized protein n=1 Tax=Chromera velia CCMP2878 TaxID=1169474 RepID=A0A0K6S646_9ALVE|eukprot:Cvel_14572.t1-p1 / transcript=Cvel_14572.t1 / gene=Cvel_14572 / organism=Chromera_velia_CCMP2878 / gene_product=hypothetical protein / transcript_product=hypothetical protein / location=Cvel_scaffold1041:44189-46757(+) / protein_length=566 / sequence_SO=supercontig / SO=protein_coding / is_pseudo=false
MEAALTKGGAQTSAFQASRNPYKVRDKNLQKPIVEVETQGKIKYMGVPDDFWNPIELLIDRAQISTFNTFTQTWDAKDKPTREQLLGIDDDLFRPQPPAATELTSKQNLNSFTAVVDATSRHISEGEKRTDASMLPLHERWLLPEDALSICEKMIQGPKRATLEAAAGLPPELRMNFSDYRAISEKVCRGLLSLVEDEADTDAEGNGGGDASSSDDDSDGGPSERTPSRTPRSTILKKAKSEGESVGENREEEKSQKSVCLTEDGEVGEGEKAGGRVKPSPSFHLEDTKAGKKGGGKWKSAAGKIINRSSSRLERRSRRRPTLKRQMSAAGKLLSGNSAMAEILKNSHVASLFISKQVKNAVASLFSTFPSLVHSGWEALETAQVAHERAERAEKTAAELEKLKEALERENRRLSMKVGEERRGEKRRGEERRGEGREDERMRGDKEARTSCRLFFVTGVFTLQKNQMDHKGFTELFALLLMNGRQKEKRELLKKTSTKRNHEAQSMDTVFESVFVSEEGKEATCLPSVSPFGVLSTITVAPAVQSADIELRTTVPVMAAESQSKK